MLSGTSRNPQHGYAICIACGRAEAETDIDSLALPAGLKNHYPLQKLRENPRADGRCPGNDESSRKVRRRVKLGTETITDVFELQLDALTATPGGQSVAWGIGAGLREALAQTLGVDAETMGVAVAPSPRPDGSRRASFFIYDKASGGSGFASTADRGLPTLLRNAAERLDCPSNCTHGCPDCVLRRDLQFGGDRLDRPGALDILKKAILPKLDLPETLRVFGPETRPVSEPLADHITRLTSTNDMSSLVLLLTDHPAEWNFSSWPGVESLAAAKDARLSVAIRKSDLTALEMSHKLDLVRLVARSGASLHIAENLPEIGGKTILAEMTVKGRVLAIATTWPEAAHLNERWGSVAEGPLLMGENPATKLSGALSLDKLTLWGEGNSAHKDITSDLNGPIGHFGTNFWKIATTLRPNAFRKGQRIISAVYNDRYLRSPLTARLLFEAWTKMPLRSPGTKLEILTEAASQEARPGHLLHHSWESDGLRKAVLSALFPGASVLLSTKSSCAHARFFRLFFEDGTTVTVFLDQGFGAWRDASERATRFDHGAAPQLQARQLEKAQFEVALQDGGRIASPIWVRW